VVLEVIGLQEDADHVAEVLKAEWAAGLRRSFVSSEMDLKTVQQEIASATRAEWLQKGSILQQDHHGMMKRDGTFQSLEEIQAGALRHYRRDDLIGKMDSETARALRLSYERAELSSKVYWAQGSHCCLCRAPADDAYNKPAYNWFTCRGGDGHCEECKKLSQEPLPLLSSRCQELVGQMDINAVSAELAIEKEGGADDKEYSAMLLTSGQLLPVATR